MDYELKYPHLEDINYPNVEQVDVFDYDYDEYQWSRWTDNVRIKLCNVPWDSDGSNAVKFDNAESRDSWFDALDGHVVDMKSMFHEMPAQIVKVPVPFPVAMTYNYLMVDTPIMPTADEPLEYENPQNRYERTFWYIMDVESSAPNTTELTILQDYWTNYIDEVDISYMMLRRGHAPVKLTTVAQYLNDPYSNREWLLAEDVNFSDNSNVSGQRFIPFGNGRKYLCFAATMSLAVFDDYDKAITLTGGNTSASYSDVSYTDLDKTPLPAMALSTNQSGQTVTEDREYRAFGVSGWNWSTGGRNALSNDVELDYYVKKGIADSVECYAVAIEDAEPFIKDMHWTYPQWFGCVLGAFTVSGDMFDTDGDIEVNVYANGTQTHRKYTAWKVRRTTGSLGYLKFNVSDFAIPDEHKNIPKLYTYPYSFVEVSEKDGRTVQFRIEDMTENVQIRFKTCFAYPWLKYAAFFDGIGGDAPDATYVWMNLNGNPENVSIYGNDWQKLLFEHDIPTFAVFQLAEERYLLDNANALDARRKGAIANYRDTVDGANTAYWNSWWKCTYDRDNTVLLNNREYENTAGSLDRTRDTAHAQNNQNVVIAQLNSEYTTHLTGHAYRKLHDDMIYDASAIRSAALIDQSYTAASAFGTMVGSIGTAVIQGTVGAGSMALGAPFMGAQEVGTAASTLIGVPATGYQSNVVIQKSQESANMGLAQLSGKYLIAERKLLQDNITVTGQSLTLDINSGTNISTGYNVVGNNPTTRGFNYILADNIRDFGNNLSDDIYDDLEDLADNLRTDRNTAAGRTQSVDRHNPNETKKSIIRGAKRDMEQVRNSALAGYIDARHGAPRPCGTFSGNGGNDVLRWRGVQVKVRTQPDDALRMAGDQMKRFGYFVNRNWNFTGFNLMEHFTYWEVSEIWLTGGSKGVPEKAQQTIKSMLRNGVTVWHNPDDIGNVTIYENWR